MEINVEGKRGRRRLNQRWIDIIENDTKKAGVCKDEMEGRP